MLSTRFRHPFDFFVENLVANLLHQSRHAEIDAAGSLVVRVLYKWNSEFTVVHPEITARITVSTHIIGFHFWKHSATHHICVCSL